MKLIVRLEQNPSAADVEVIILIHAGLAFLRRFECESGVLETLRNLSYVVIVILGFGAVFGWFSSTPVWAIVPMCAAVYGLGLLLSVFRIREKPMKLIAC